MQTSPVDRHERQELAADLRTWLDASVASQGGHDEAVKPDHYRPWHWPVHPISFDYHIPSSEWHGHETLEVEGKSYSVSVARTPWGVFGRCEALRVEAKGDSDELMLQALQANLQPLLDREKEIGQLIQSGQRYSGSIRDLSPEFKLRLFFAADRAIGHDAQSEIETDGGLSRYLLAFLEILKERRHWHRRTAQWLVLDLFEDLRSYCETTEDENLAIEEIANLMWQAEDDFARTIYKAGVVLGGHVCTEHSADTIMKLMSAPSRIARRSAMHASFHMCEWMPQRTPDVVAQLRHLAQSDPEPMLRPYAVGLAQDIESQSIDHIAEPIFPDEP